jgi:hypothetical protein
MPPRRGRPRSDSKSGAAHQHLTCDFVGPSTRLGTITPAGRYQCLSVFLRDDSRPIAFQRSAESARVAGPELAHLLPAKCPQLRSWVLVDRHEQLCAELERRAPLRVSRAHLVECLLSPVAPGRPGTRRWRSHVTPGYPDALSVSRARAMSSRSRSPLEMPVRMVPITAWRRSAVRVQ